MAIFPRNIGIIWVIFPENIGIRDDFYRKVAERAQKEHQKVAERDFLTINFFIINFLVKNLKKSGNFGRFSALFVFCGLLFVRGFAFWLVFVRFDACLGGGWVFVRLGCVSWLWCVNFKG